jgi:hypothetical protein
MNEYNFYDVIRTLLNIFSKVLLYDAYIYFMNAMSDLSIQLKSIEKPMNKGVGKETAPKKTDVKAVPAKKVAGKKAVVKSK